MPCGGLKLALGGWSAPPAAWRSKTLRNAPSQGPSYAAEARAGPPTRGPIMVLDWAPYRRRAWSGSPRAGSQDGRDRGALGGASRVAKVAWVFGGDIGPQQSMEAFQE